MDSTCQVDNGGTEENSEGENGNNGRMYVCYLKAAWNPGTLFQYFLYVAFLARAQSIDTKIVYASHFQLLCTVQQ